jgi:hypothetical protein
MKAREFICTNPEELQKSLSHPDARIRRRAICDILFQKNSLLLPLLLTALNNETDVRNRYEINRALFLLNSAGNTVDCSKSVPEKTLNHLRQELQSGDMEQVNTAFRRIVRQRIWDLLPDMETIAAENDSTYQKCLLLRLMGKDNTGRFFETILSYLSDIDPHVVSTAIEVLETMGNSAASASIAWFADHPNHRVRATALKALHNMGDLSALNLLEKMAESDDKDSQKAANWGIESLKKQKNAYQNHKSSSAVKTVIEKISLLKDYASPQNSRILPTLHKLLHKDSTPEIISTVISAIGRFRHTTSIAILTPFLEHENDRIRANAIQALGIILPGPQLEILRPFLEDAHHRVISSTIVALHKQFPAESLSALRKMAESLSEKEQLSAIYCMGAIETDLPADLFRHLYQSDSPKVKERLSDFLQTRNISCDEFLKSPDYRFSLTEIKELLTIKQYSFSNDNIRFQANIDEYELEIEGCFQKDENGNWHCHELRQRPQKK